MIEDEIIKHLPEAVGVAKVAAASIPFTAIVKRMLGPAADELAEMWKDQIRLYRYERQLKCVEKAEKMAKDAGFTPKAVPPKILFPLLDGASLEENEDLHTMWAALLAKAASPHKGSFNAGFMMILRSLSVEDAKMLMKIYDDACKRYENGVPVDERPYAISAHELIDLCHEFLKFPSTVGPRAFYTNLGLFESSIGNLESHRLVKLLYTDAEDDYPEHCRCKITARGFAFVEACQPPKPKS